MIWDDEGYLLSKTNYSENDFYKLLGIQLKDDELVDELKFKVFSPQDSHGVVERNTFNFRYKFTSVIIKFTSCHTLTPVVIHTLILLYLLIFPFVSLSYPISYFVLRHPVMHLVRL